MGRPRSAEPWGRLSPACRTSSASFTFCVRRLTRSSKRTGMRRWNSRSRCAGSAGSSAPWRAPMRLRLRSFGATVPRCAARSPMTAARRLGAEAQGAVGEGGRKSGPPGAKGGGSPRLARLRRLIGRGLEGTAALWSDVERAYGWVHRAAHILSNPDGEDAAKVRRRFDGLLAAKVRRRFDGLLAAMARHRGQAGSLAEAVGHFCKVARSYRPGLFHCYAVPGLPRTDNGLEHLFGSQRYHERRANGRKAASPAAVLRGEVRLIAATATRLRPPDARELG